jgi:ADP-ribose pyrophosphatase YjhB (NUDIX family)
MSDLSIIIDGVKFNFRVGLLVKMKKQVLVECNQDYDFVVLPGGRVKTLESSEDALIREINEEMKIDLTNYNLEFIGADENFFELDNIKYHELYFIYKIEIDENNEDFKDGMINYDSKVNYYKLVDILDLKEVNLLPKSLINIIDSNGIHHSIQKDL